jgi:hypothetical protein
MAVLIFFLVIFSGKIRLEKGEVLEKAYWASAWLISLIENLSPYQIPALGIVAPVVLSYYCSQKENDGLAII